MSLNMTIEEYCKGGELPYADNGSYSVDMVYNKVAELEKAIDRIEWLLNNMRIVKHGHWLPHPNPEYREWDVCSSCGTVCKRREYHVDFMTKTEREEQFNYPYCPNCGAKMDEKTAD